jgi:hypothetical protein
MSQRLLLLAFLVFFSVLPVWSQLPVQVATSDMPEATAFNNGHKLAFEGWITAPLSIHAVFTSANDVFHSFSTNRGSTWSSPVNVSLTSGPSRYPAIVRDSLLGALFAVWQDSTSGQNEIYCSSYQGNAWSTPINVSNTPGQSIHPSLDADRQGRLHLVYVDNSSGNYDIYYQRYESGAWSDTLNLSRNTGLSDFPSVGAYGDDVYVCWEDNTPGNFDIFERHWNGSAWSVFRNMSQSPVNSLYPSLSCPSSWDPGFSVTWGEMDSAHFELVLNGGRWSSARPCLFPVVSVVGRTWTYLAWQEPFGGMRDSIYFRYLYGFWFGPFLIDAGRYPSVVGANFLYTKGDTSPYRVLFWATGYPVGVAERNKEDAFTVFSFTIHPNPSPGRMTVELSLPQPASLLLEVYDLQGAVVRTLARAKLPPGRHEFLWDGRNDFGHKVPSGVYLLRASAGSKSQTARVLLLR